MSFPIDPPAKVKDDFLSPSRIHPASIPQISHKPRTIPQKSPKIRVFQVRYGTHSHLLEISLRAISRGFESLSLRQNLSAVSKAADFFFAISALLTGDFLIF